MKRTNRKRAIIAKFVLFMVFIVLSFGINIKPFDEAASSNKHFVQFGMNKVWADNPWENYIVRSTGYNSYGKYANYIVINKLLNSTSEFDSRGAYLVPTGDYKNKILIVPYYDPPGAYGGEMYSSGGTPQTCDLDFAMYNYIISFVSWSDNHSSWSYVTSGNIVDESAINSETYGGIDHYEGVLTIQRQLKNQNPTINVSTPSQNGTFSEVAGYNTISLQGSVSDPNTGDIITTKYNIDGGTTQTVSGTVTTSGSFTTTNISVGSLSEGSHTLNVWCVDNQGATFATTAIPFKVDKTKPTLGTVTVTSTTNSTTISGSASDAIAGLDPYPYRYTVSTKPATSWLTATSYAQSTLAANTQYTATFEARDSKGHIASKTQNIYTKAAVPTVTVNNATSYTLDVAMSDSNPTTTPYQIIVNSNKYVTPEGILTTSPVWITPSGKKITVKGLAAQTAYTFQVKAKNGDGVETALSSAVSGTTLIAPPVPPVNITATATDKTITVAWDTSATATGYDIEADGTVVNTGTSTTYTHTNLAPGTPHTYRIRGKNAGGPGNWSTSISKSTLQSSPGIPANLSAVPLNTTITVTWDNVAGATGYDIEVDGAQVNNGPNTSYKHTSLTPGTSHTYRVRSVNSGGKSDWGSPITVVTLLESTPVPTDFEATAGKNQITVTWNAVNGATGYEIEVDGVRINNNTKTSYTHSNLQPGTEHMYRVRAKKGTILSDWTAMIVVTTLTDGFGIPGNIKANASDTTMTLTWAPVTDAIDYDIEIDGVINDIGSNTTCKHEGLRPNSTHTYKVRAKSVNETSDWSDLITVKTFSLPTPQIVTTSATETSIKTVWEEVYGAATYDLEFDGSVIADITETEYTCEGLNPGEQHLIRVRAKNNIGTSNWSETATESTVSTGLNIPFISGMAAKNLVIVMWNSIGESTGYDLEVDGAIIENIGETSYLHNALAPGTQHTYRVRTRNGSETGEWSGIFTLYTLSETPAVPTNVVTSANTTSILITWDQVSGAEDYEVEVDGVVVDNGTGTSYLHSSLTPETTHKYRVRARNLGGFSGWSTLIEKATLSTVQTFNIDCTAGNELNLLLSAANIQDVANYTFTVRYNVEELEVLDLCGITPRIDTSTGNITGTDIKVTQYEPGTIVFTKISSVPSWEVWSGVVNSIKLKAKRDGQSTVTYSIN